MATHVYPSDLHDEEWALLAPLIPPVCQDGRPRSVDIRGIVNGLFSVLRSGCAWRYLPREYGPWQTVYYYFRHWCRDGTWIRIHARLRKLARLHVGRDPTPSAAIIDSQSVKTLMGGVRGFDGNKKLVGVKQHILVDTEGFFLAVVVHAANIPDRKGGQQVWEAASEAYPRLQHIWADQGYTGTVVRWAAQEHGWRVQVVYPQFRQLKRSAPEVLEELGAEPGFRLIPRRWVVERTFSWVGRQRRLRKHYERLTSTEEVFMYRSASTFFLLAWHQPRRDGFSNT